VAFVGKLKTAAQMSAIPLLLFEAPVLGFDRMAARYAC
jgi:cardiolipin synthase